MPSNHRIERLNDLIRSEISQMIQREMKDPRIAGLVSVTDVELTEDLRHARVYVSVLGSEDERKATMQTLQRAAGFFRRLLGERLTIRYIPEVEFRYDEGIERGSRVLELLRQVAEEEATQQSAVAEIPQEQEPARTRRRARIVYRSKEQ